MKIFSKKLAHKIYKGNLTELNYNQFSNLRTKCKKQNLITKNPNSFWNYINSKWLNTSISIEISYANQNFFGGENQ